MKLIFVFLLITSYAFSQGVVDKVINDAKTSVLSNTGIQSERRFSIIEYWVGGDSAKMKFIPTRVIYVSDGMVTKLLTPADTATLYLSADPAREMKGTVTWKYADQRFDTTFTQKEIVDDPSTSSRWVIVNMFKQPNSTKPEQLYNKSFSAVSNVSSASSAKIEWEGGRIEFFSEQYQGHGNVKILIDGVQVKTLFQGRTPYGTDYPRGIPSYGWTGPIGKHTLELQTDPGNQYIIDGVRVFNYTLKPR